MNVQRKTMSQELLQAVLDADELAVQRLINLRADVKLSSRR